ncbi:Outer membrane protein NlpB, lipoprotein component of the protein assembly complex (forms a complex with YaeT, YfiO, and YfgL); Lipoprotein-34 precursor [plant metagenome]|uniref:Outer membrane protein NlpB, lipoprotein component of the protein assembly complex (Forms a complex with YaeT, YfiO, and YfgL) Lipoprotein-34 n=1 Tax=plant metagenome TaxID=1297885 RepID=A0A484TYB5_9ZZZZ
MNKRHAGAAALVALLLSGCSNVNEMLGREESVNYKGAVRGERLSIPPDLTQAASDPRYSAPASGTTTFTEYQQQGQQASQQAASANRQSTVLPEQTGMRVERDGNLRWLSVDRTPEDIYPRIVEFWGQQGFVVTVSDPKAGLIQTEWTENRAKVPEGWIRSALGSIIDQAWDSGERERFRTRIERVDGRTEVYVSHEQMLEKRIGGYDSAQVAWEHGKEDPGLNAAMLARMLVFLGTDVERARTLVAQAESQPQRPQVEQSEATGDATLRVAEPFDRAWRRVGIALDSAGFTVDDRNRSTGEYYVRYLDTDTGQKREDPNFFSRLFGTGTSAQAAQYRLQLREQGGTTFVTVLDAKGERDASPTARRLLGVLADRL